MQNLRDDVIFEAVVGSHQFGMARPDSDLDLFQIYREPITGILDGTAHYQPQEVQTPKCDTSKYEVKHHVDMLLKGNINHVMGILGTPRFTTPEAQRLQRIFQANHGKNICKSVFGLTEQLYKRYMEVDRLEPKRCGLVLRVINLAVSLMERREPEFRPVPLDHALIPAAVARLEKARDESTLPAHPDAQPYREFVVDVRLDQIRREYPI